MQPETDLLQAEKNLDHVFHDARDSRELMRHTRDLDRTDGRPFKRRKQHSPKRIAQSRSISRIASENLEFSMILTE